jgi:hypothetical protein
MKPIRFLAPIVALLLSACQGWSFEPHTSGVRTPAPSRTPSIQTATPLILWPTLSPTASSSPDATETYTLTPASSTPEVPTASDTPTLASDTPTVATPAGAVSVDILGCESSLDIVHGMGEVTNAYVRVRNSTPADIPDLCATLNGIDESRPHPDKTKCIPVLPSASQVTLKLTVDTTFQQQTEIQIELTSGGAILMRVGEPACVDTDYTLSTGAGFGTPEPLP